MSTFTAASAPPMMLPSYPGTALQSVPTPPAPTPPTPQPQQVWVQQQPGGSIIPHGNGLQPSPYQHHQHQPPGVVQMTPMGMTPANQQVQVMMMQGQQQQQSPPAQQQPQYIYAQPQQTFPQQGGQYMVMQLPAGSAGMPAGLSNSMNGMILASPVHQPMMHAAYQQPILQTTTGGQQQNPQYTAGLLNPHVMPKAPRGGRVSASGPAKPQASTISGSGATLGSSRGRGANTNNTSSGTSSSKNARRNCHFCGSAGHVVKECPKVVGTEEDKGCWGCGQQGHQSKDCPFASLVAEQVSVATEEDEEE